MEQEPKKKRLSSSPPPTMPGVSGSKSDEFEDSTLNFSDSSYLNNNTFTKRSESTGKLDDYFNKLLL